MKDGQFPAFFYDPETHEAKQCNGPDDVPAGWVETIGDEAPAPAKAKAKPADDSVPMARKDIMAELKNGGIAFDVKAKTADLYDLLKGKVMEALTAKNIAFDADASAADLLKQLS
jgi:hypothetical protein